MSKYIPGVSCIQWPSFSFEEMMYLIKNSSTSQKAWDKRFDAKKTKHIFSNNWLKPNQLSSMHFIGNLRIIGI